MLSPVGRMALTNYLVATLLILLGNTAFGLSDTVNILGVLALGAAIGVIQAVVSFHWLRAFRYGPVKWAWRCLTWWEAMPLGPRAR